LLEQQPCSGLGRPIVEVLRSYTHTHTHTHSVGLLWTRDRKVAETCTLQYTKFARNIHARLGIQTHISSKRAAVVLRPRQRGRSS